MCFTLKHSVLLNSVSLVGVDLCSDRHLSHFTPRCSARRSSSGYGKVHPTYDCLLTLFLQSGALLLYGCNTEQARVGVPGIATALRGTGQGDSESTMRRYVSPFLFSKESKYSAWTEPRLAASFAGTRYHSCLLPCFLSRDTFYDTSRPPPK